MASTAATGTSCDRLRKPPLGLKHFEQHGEAQPRGAGLVAEQHAVGRAQRPTIVDILTCLVAHSCRLQTELGPNQAIVCSVRRAPEREQRLASRRTGRDQLGQRAALYCRVSTADQSCARQERDLTAFAGSCRLRGGQRLQGNGVRREARPHRAPQGHGARPGPARLTPCW